MKKFERKVLSVILVFLMGAGMVFAGGGQQEAGGGKKTIALLPPAMISPFYASVIKGAKEVADRLGYNLTTLAPDSESNYSAQVQIMEYLITFNSEYEYRIGHQTRERIPSSYSLMPGGEERHRVV
jgi:ribose transport system substrate-binding protein